MYLHGFRYVFSSCAHHLNSSPLIRSIFPRILRRILNPAPHLSQHVVSGPSLPQHLSGGVRCISDKTHFCPTCFGIFQFPVASHLGCYFGVLFFIRGLSTSRTSQREPFGNLCAPDESRTTTLFHVLLAVVPLRSLVMTLFALCTTWLFTSIASLSFVGTNTVRSQEFFRASPQPGFSSTALRVIVVKTRRLSFTSDQTAVSGLRHDSLIKVSQVPCELRDCKDDENQTLETLVAKVEMRRRRSRVLRRGCPQRRAA